eukprot:sb/3471319/
MLLCFVLLIGGGGFDGYYVRPVPTSCRFRHHGNYSPQFRIKKGQPKCMGGWRKWKNKCYIEAGHRNWQDGERHCNQHEAHIWQPNDREEYQWVEQNVMKHNDWHFLGTVCNSKGKTPDVADFYTASGEDMREINKKLNAKMAGSHRIDSHNMPCMLTHRNNNSWRWRYHQSHCNERRRIVCEAPMG